MKLLRWLLFIPVSAIVAIAVGFLWMEMFTEASYSEHHILRSIVGLAPSFLGRALPVTIFVVLGTLIAPGPGLVTVSSLGIIGGVYGWPWGPIYEEFVFMHTIYLVEVGGAITGAAIGMSVGFTIARRKKKPNQPVQRNASTGSVSNFESPARRG